MRMVFLKMREIPSGCISIGLRLFLAQLGVPVFLPSHEAQKIGHMKTKKGIHLVAPSKEVKAMQEHVPTARLQKYGFIADIVSSSNQENGTIYHYVIQPEHSREIVFWGQELSFKRALDSVESFFEPYRRAVRTA
jgi:hypothetical protein